MGAYDILTGTQLCMAVAMIAYGFYWRRIGMIKPPVTLGVSKFSYSKKKNLS